MVANVIGFVNSARLYSSGVFVLCLLCACHCCMNQSIIKHPPDFSSGVLSSAWI